MGEATWLLVVMRKGWQLPVNFMESQKVQDVGTTKQNLMKKEKLSVRDFPSGPVVKIPCPPLQGAWAQLLRDLRSHMPCDLAKNKTKLTIRTTAASTQRVGAGVELSQLSPGYL